MIRLVLLAALLALRAFAADEGTSVRLFNGRDLTGWVNVNGAPETWTVQDGMIHCTGRPTGALRTDRQYENFILELDWRHLTKGGNSGVFIWATPIAAPGVPFLRSIEVQVLDTGYDASGKGQWYTTHGDVFPIHGATMTPFGRHNGMRSFPSEDRSKSSPEWNHYQVVCSNGVIRLSVNGQQVSGGEDCNYRKGYIGLESEGGPIDFRNIQLRELPTSSAPEKLTAPVDQGWQSLFTGLDLRGWQTNSAAAQSWTVRDEVLTGGSAQAAEGQILWTDRDFANAEFVLDSRLPGSSSTPATAIVHLGASPERAFSLPLQGGKAGEFHRWLITVNHRTISVNRDGEAAQQLTLPADFPPHYRLGLSLAHGTAEFRNLYERGL